MSIPERAHGLTPDQWLRIFEKSDWRGAVHETLEAIASCSHAYPEDREVAVAIWNFLAINELIPDQASDGRSLPQVICDTQLSALRGQLQIDERERELCHERLTGVQNVVRTIRELHRVKGKLGAFNPAPQLDTGAN